MYLIEELQAMPNSIAGGKNQIKAITEQILKLEEAKKEIENQIKAIPDNHAELLKLALEDLTHDAKVIDIKEKAKIVTKENMIKKFKEGKMSYEELEKQIKTIN